MSEIIKIKTHIDNRGALSVIDYSDFPFSVKRIYYIYNVDDSERAQHRHKITKQLLICLNGSCNVHVNNGIDKFNYILNKPNIGLLLNPEDWHIVNKFTKGSTLMVLASESYNEEDYIFKPYHN